MKHAKAKIKRSPAEKEAIYTKPLSEQFEVIYTHPESGFSVYKHILAEPEAEDYAQVLVVAKAYTAECDCRINPIVDKSAITARQKIYPSIEDDANPDLYTEKYGYIDVKSPFGKNKIIKNANHACQQGAMAVITDLRLNEEMTHKRILQTTAKIFSADNKNDKDEPNYTKEQVHWFVKGTLLKYNRSKKN